MEPQNVVTSQKDRILQAFQQLLATHKQFKSRVATKQEVAEREAERTIVEKASTYTVENIVKGLADLQLSFGNAVDSLTAQLAVEAPKLEELRQAIQIETRYLEELQQIRTAADALDILMQEHEEKTHAFTEQSQQEQQTLDQEITAAKQAWRQEQEEFDATLQERQAFLKKEREQEEADYQYDLVRQRKIEADEFSSRKAAIEQQIAQESAKREADWTEREKVLAEQQEMIPKYRVFVEAFPQELADAFQKAREEAIAQVGDEANIQEELFEKEQQANKNFAEQKIASLKETIEQQTVQIEHLSAQLHAAQKHVQDLAVRAVESTGKSGKAKSSDLAGQVE